MIDPLGPDPSDPVLPARQIGEIVPEIKLPEPPKPTRPKIRFANYDRPEALARHVSEPVGDTAKTKPDPPEPASPPQAETLPPERDPGIRPPETALVKPTPPLQKPNKLKRAIGVAKTVLPLVGKMLPLLEGNVVSAASNLLLHQPFEVDLKPLEEAIARLQAEQRALTFHTTEQKRALRRLEDQFTTLQEQVQRNAEQQAELAEQLAKLAKHTASFNRLIIILLVLSLLFTALLCVRIAYIIRF